MKNSIPTNPNVVMIDASIIAPPVGVKLLLGDSVRGITTIGQWQSGFDCWAYFPKFPDTLKRKKVDAV